MDAAADETRRSANHPERPTVDARNAASLRENWTRAFDLLIQTGDAAFTLDGVGRIAGWNAAAERLLGFTGDDVRGRPCYQVLGCQDLLGRPLCSANCSFIQSIQQGTLPSSAAIVARHRRGDAIELSAHVFLVTAPAGPAAIVVLRPSTQGIVRARPGFGAGPAPHLDLAGTLDRLLNITGADAAELFLTMPTGGQLALVMHRGRSPRAFRQVVRFEPGRGFAGLVAERGEPLVSLDLPHDERYLRTEVKRQGFRYYLCVPALSDSTVMGSLHITSRRHPERIVAQLPFLSQVAAELGTALELQRLRAAERVISQPLDATSDASANLKRVADHTLKTLMETAGVDAGAILLFADGSAETLQPASGQGVPSPVQRTLAARCRPAACPAIARQWTVLPTDRAQAESPCCQMVRRHLTAALCLPLMLGEKPLGVILLAHQNCEPLPTQHLSFLHAAFGRAALMIHNAQVALREEREARQRAALALPVKLPVATAAAGIRASALDDVPFLDFRCLGPFTILRDGLPVSPRQFTRRRSLTLLKILLMRYGKQVHREEIAELLWPEASLVSTNVLLNAVVHRLRRGLEPDAPAGHLSSFISTDGDTYAFNTASPHRLDSQEFLEAVRLGMACELRDAPAAITAYQRAVGLYAGDFLEEEIYSDWCALDREYLREHYLTALRRLAVLRFQQNDVDAAVTCYRRALRIDATLEDVHRELMMVLWQSGRRDEALRQYQECCAVLDRELGIAPMPETEALRRQIAAGA